MCQAVTLSTGSRSTPERSIVSIPQTRVHRGQHLILCHTAKATHTTQLRSPLRTDVTNPMQGGPGFLLEPLRGNSELSYGL